MNTERYEALHRLCDLYGYNTVYNLVLRLQPWSTDETLKPFIQELREVLLTSIVDSDYYESDDHSSKPMSEESTCKHAAGKRI